MEGVSDEVDIAFARMQEAGPQLVGSLERCLGLAGIVGELGS